MSKLSRSSRRPLIYVLVCAVLVSVPWSITFWSISEHHAEHLASKLNHAERVAIFFERNVIQLFNYSDNYVRSARRAYLNDGGIGGVESYLAAVPLDKTIVSHVTIIGSDGVPILNSAHALRPGVNAVDRGYFKAMKAATDDRLFISKPHKGRNSGKLIVRVVRRISLPDGAFGGVVFAAMEAKSFTEFMKAHHLGPASEAALVGLDKSLRALSNAGINGLKIDISQSGLWGRLQSEKTGIIREISPVDGLERYVAYRQLEAYPLVVKIGVSAAAMTQLDANHDVQQFAIAAMLSIFLIAGVLLYGRKGAIGVELEQEVSRQTAALRGEIEEREKSDQRFRDFSEASADWFWEMDKDLRFTYFSDRFESITGVPPSMLLGKTREETGVPNVDADVWEQQLQDLAAHRPFRAFEHPRTLADGTVVQLSINGVPIFSSDGSFLGYRGTGSDITGRKIVEAQLLRARDELEREVESQTAELREGRERFRDFAESGADWLWEMDDQLRFTYMSPNVERTVGVTPEWHYGKTREDILGENYDREIWAEHLETLKARKPFRDFTYFRVGDGIEAKWLSSSGKPVFAEDGRFLGYRGTGSDVTVLRQREIALAESERNLREILERSPVGVAIVRYSNIANPNTFQRHFVNHALVTMFGFDTRDEMLATGSNYENTWIEPEELEIFKERIRAGGNLVGFQARRRREDGTEWIVSIDTRPVHFDNQDCIMVWHHDITERVRAEDALGETVEQHRLVTDSLPVMIVYFDGEKRYRFINETGTRWEMSRSMLKS